jgi:hypothetical protein
MSSTRISDLPDNITTSLQPIGGGYQNPPQLASMETRRPPSEEMNLTYTQMNVHPNPYGNPQQPSVMTLPQGQPQYRLPSRDIPMDTDIYMQDEAITPNYIPPAPKLTGDYIRDYEQDEEVEIKNHKKKKNKEKLMDTMMTELQIPMFIAVIFFIFQLPIVNTMIFKRFSFLSIYSEDGNFNMYGLFLKSALFGFVYYSLTKIIDYLSDI